MSDIAGLPQHTYTESHTFPQAGKKTGGKQLLKAIIVLLFIALAAELVFYVIVLPFTSPAKCYISGIRSISEEELKTAAGLTSREVWGKLNTEVLSRRIAANCPVIEHVKITKKYPDRVLIEVVERKPVAVLLVGVDSRTVPMEIDKTGMVFKIASKDTSRTLPIISGLSFQNIRAGMKVHKQLVPLFQQLDVLQKKNPALLSEISEMKIEQKKYGGFDLLLYPVQTRIKVRTDSALNEDRLRYMMLTVDVIRQLNLTARIEELDVRSGTASYRLRGETDE